MEGVRGIDILGYTGRMEDKDRERGIKTNKQQRGRDGNARQ